MTHPKWATLAVATLAIGLAGGFLLANHGSGTRNKSGRKILYWVDPMHPSYKSDKPGIAPDCGMKLVPVYEDNSLPSQAPHEVSGNGEAESSPEDMPPGTINISPEKQQLIGVRYATVGLVSGTQTVRAAGRVAPDETRISRLHPKIEGWIYKTNIDFTGELVHKGDPLLTAYSPEMLATQKEFLLALKARDAMEGGPSREAYGNSQILVEAARRRLELWDLSSAQIEEIERTGRTIQTVTLYSPASGYVTSRNAFPSGRVSPETELYSIADLSRVWIMADVFETDMAKVQLGENAIVRLPHAEGRSISAKVSYIQPQIDPVTRTLKVRLDAPNPDLRLKPDMFVEVEFRFELPPQLAVPADAVVNTGTRKTVFVDQGNGLLERREVVTGERMGDQVQILSGLHPGERVAASGTFLIDSEAQMKSAAATGPVSSHHHGEHAHD